MYFHQEIRGCLKKTVKDHGLIADFYKELLPQLNKTLEALKLAFEKNTLPLLKLPYRKDDIETIKDLSLKIQDDFSDVVVLGTGGSSLGGQALTALATHKKRSRLHFLDNIDPKTFTSLLKRLHLKETFFIVISKSGATSETLVQFLSVVQEIKLEIGRDAIKDHFIIITEPKKSPLRNLADHFSIPTLDHDPKIGGRFSVFSIVGLLPAMLVGIDPLEVREGAARIMDRLLSSDTAENLAPALGAALSYLLEKEKGKTTSVMLPYVDELDCFSFWYRQLWAESLGKKGKGTTPINALGAVDQHSQLQLYLDGPRDKFFTVIVSSMENKGAPIHERYKEIDKNLSYLSNATMGDLMEAEQRATIDTLIQNKCPTRVIEIPDVTPDFMGMLMMHFMLETIFTADLYGVNAFDQPAVEEGKILAKQYLAKTLKERLHG